MRLSRRLADAVFASVMVAAITSVAQAGPAPDPNVDKADQLFREGRALWDSNLLQACDRFTESLRLNPAAIGTLMNVALCDEKLGRVASAMTRFTEARDRAREQRLSVHVTTAEEHIQGLAPSVPHLQIQLRETAPDLKVLVDDRVIAPGALDDVMVDPGERVIVVSASGRLPYRTKMLAHKSERVAVVIPPLQRAISVSSSRRKIGQIVTASGVGVIGVGVGFGLYARHLHHAQFDNDNCQHTDKGDLCNTTGQDRTQRARTLGNVGTMIGIGGVIAAGVGAYLWFTAPTHSGSSEKLAVLPDVAPDRIGVSAVGRF